MGLTITSSSINLPSADLSIKNSVFSDPLVQKIVRVALQFLFSALFFYWIKDKISPLKALEEKNFLTTHGLDLTKLVNEEKLSPALARDSEISEVVNALCRKGNANALLIGESGVGKKSIVYGFAKAISEKRVPQQLEGKKVISIDVSSLVSGCSYIGMLERRIANLVKEVKEAKNIILFFPNIHQLTGNGGSRDTSSNMATMLSTALSAGDIQCIGTTTPQHYTNTLEKEPSISNLFNPVPIEPLSCEATCSVLLSIQNRYESFHKCRYTQAALLSAIHLSERYIYDTHLPAKAIALLDAAGAVAPRQENYWVGVREIADILSKRMNIPLEQLAGTGETQILKMEEELKRRVIGQDEAIKAVCGALLVSRAGLNKPNKPIGVFFFAGPSGVGKTMVAEQLALHMFGTEKALIRINMNEYTAPNNASRLIGAPPGHIGYGEGGELSEKVRKKPYSVLLLDEFEKSNPDIQSFFLQIFDQGTISDACGRRVDFSNTIIIMCSNLGAHLKKETEEDDPISNEEIAKNIKTAIQTTLRAEFIGRLDEVVVFNKIAKENLSKLVDLEVKELNENLKKKNGKSFSISAEAKEFLVEKGISPELGARRLIHTIKQHALRLLALAMTQNPHATSFLVTLEDNKIKALPSC
jgi:ATP-dependent Clp protease ATP-binding subunit ClpC